MRYIKTYENLIEYKDGDIVVLDIQKLIDYYKELPNSIITINFFKNLNPIQKIYYRNSKKYIKDDLWKSVTDYTDKFYIHDSFIERLATPEEIEKYYKNKQIKKYNL